MNIEKYPLIRDYQRVAIISLYILAFDPSSLLMDLDSQCLFLLLSIDSECNLEAQRIESATAFSNIDSPVRTLKLATKIFFKFQARIPLRSDFSESMELLYFNFQELEFLKLSTLGGGYQVQLSRLKFCQHSGYTSGYWKSKR